MPSPARLASTDRSLRLLLLSLVLVIFVVQPLQQLDVAGPAVVGLFFSFILISGVATIAKTNLVALSMGGLVFIGLGLRWLRLALHIHALAMPDAFLSALLCAILAGVVLVQVFREGPITVQRIEGAVAVYLLLGLAWAFT